MKILKVGDQVYSSSFADIHRTYKTGFPQREKFLWADLSGCEVKFWGHEPIDSFEVLEKERFRFGVDFMLDSCSNVDLIVVDNPYSALVATHWDLDPNAVIADVIDWYLGMLEVESKNHPEQEKYCLMKLGVEMMCNKVTQWVFQSPVIRDEWERRGADTTKSIVIPNGYDGDKFKVQHCLDHKYPRVLFVGKLGRWYEELFNVIKALPSDWNMRIVGDGPLKMDLQTVASKLDKWVDFTGVVPHEEIPEYIQWADVCVMPVDDCSPIATMEYLACGKIVIHRGDKIRWLIQDGVNGYIASGTVDSYRRAFRLADNDKLKVSKNSDKAVATSVSWYEWNTLRKVLSRKMKGWVGDVTGS